MFTITVKFIFDYNPVFIASLFTKFTTNFSCYSYYLPELKFLQVSFLISYHLSMKEEWNQMLYIKTCKFGAFNWPVGQNSIPLICSHLQIPSRKPLWLENNYKQSKSNETVNQQLQSKINLPKCSPFNYLINQNLPKLTCDGLRQHSTNQSLSSNNTGKLIVLLLSLSAIVAALSIFPSFFFY